MYSRKKILASSVAISISALLALGCGSSLTPPTVEAAVPPGDGPSSRESSLFSSSAASSSGLAFESLSFSLGDFAASLSSAVNSAIPREKPKPVVMTKEEIKEAVKKEPTKEDLAEDPGANKKPQEPSQPNEDTIKPPSKPPVSSESSSSGSQASSQTPSSSQASSSSGTGSSSSSSQSSSSGGESSSGSGSSSSSSSSSSTQPPHGLPDGWQTVAGKKYYYYGGSPVTEWQTIGGRRYLFGTEGALSSKTGIDVSTYQGDNVDWKAVKADGVDFVILRVGFRGYGKDGNLVKDARFEKNYTGAKAAGLSIGIYFFSQAITEQEARDEAEFCLEMIKTHPIDGPVMFDPEFAYSGGNIGRLYDAQLTAQQQTDIALAFCGSIRKGGYKPGVYTNKSWALNRFRMSRLSGNLFWYARYVQDELSQKETGRQARYWQYSSTGRVAGISGNVDMNVYF